MRRWFRRQVIARLKRAHWLFRAPDLLHMKLLQLDGIRADHDQLALATAKLGARLRDVSERLEHHEKGALKASRASLDKKHADGILALAQPTQSAKRAKSRRRR